MEKSVCTPFGKTIKKRLVDIDKKQSWLIEQVSKDTGLYFDGSYLYKVMTGEKKSPKIIQAICEILGISDAPTE